MAAIVYASQTDLAAWVAPDGIPDNWAPLLRSASFRIARATNRDPYTDAPSADDAPPLRDATCAQVAAWAALGINPDAGGLDQAPIKRSVVLDATVEQDTTGQAAALQTAAQEVCATARDILTQAGLLWLPVPLSSTCAVLPSWGQSRQWPFGYDPTTAASTDAWSIDALRGW